MVEAESKMPDGLLVTADSKIYYDVVGHVLIEVLLDSGIVHWETPDQQIL